MALLIQPATILEWPQIEALRDAYFARMRLPVQERPEARWYVARVGERVVGCYSYVDVPEYHQRWAMDFYRADGYSGARAVALMYRHLYEGAGVDQYDVVFTIDPRNKAWRRVVGRYLKANCVGMIYLHETQRGR